MGRSRAVPNSADDDAYQRSKRRRAASSGENFETMATVPGTSDGKKVLYHCNYCNKDISGKIRMKCTKCADFDLCLECFSVGAEVAPHKSNHPYRVMDSLSFPLICPDWNADEEILLLEGMEMYGLGNWAEIAEHVGTKNKAQCIDHYMTAYLNSPCYPLPDMSHVNGKNRKDLLAMAKVEDECKKGISVFGNITQKAECLFSPSRVKLENLNREAPAGRSSSILTAAAGANKKASNMGQFNTDNDGTQGEDLTSSQDPCMDRSVGVKKPKYSGDQGPSLVELSGYNPWRHEFDPEYDDDAEQALAEMEFKESDSETERELKLRVLHIYLSRLNERKRRKDFILERNLLYPKPLEKELSSEDREIYQRYKVFMCFQSQEEHEALVQSALEERRIRRRIQELQECRAAGCRTLAEAKIYSEQKRKRDSEAIAQQGKEGSQVVASKASAKANRGMNREKGGCDGIVQNTPDNHKMKGGSGLEISDEDTTSIITGQTTTRSIDDWDITGLPAADLLSKAEQQLCCQNRLLPSHYLQIQEVLTREILKGTIVERSDAHGFFEVDPSKVDLIFDIVNKKVGPACLI